MEGLSLGAELSRLIISGLNPEQGVAIHLAESDLLSITRARKLAIIDEPIQESDILDTIDSIEIAVRV
jgi:hypothetical protein